MVTKPSGSAAPKLEVLEAGDIHAAEIAAFFRAVWDPAATTEDVLAARQRSGARNVVEPGRPAPTFIALQGGQVLGYVTTIPIQWWDGHATRPGHWIKGLMVLPEFRSGPIGYLVLKAAVAGLPTSGALAVAAPALRLFGALGYKDLGPMPNWIRPLAPGRIIQRLDLASTGLSGLPSWAPAALRLGQRSGLGYLGGWLGGAALRTSAALRRAAATRHLRVEPLDPAAISADLGALWARVRPVLGATAVRDARYLLERYPVGGESPYLWLGLRAGGECQGVAILRRPRASGDPRLHGIRVATLADLLFDPTAPGHGLSLLGGAEALARSLKADAILFSGTDARLASLLPRQHYFKLGGNVHFLLRQVAGDAGLPPDISSWWLTRGDGLADEVF